MKLKLHLGKNANNHHGTQPKGEPWNRETVKGWKVTVIDLLGPIKQQGRKTSAVWYKRFILYLPSGAWWNLDVALRKESTNA